MVTKLKKNNVDFDKLQSLTDKFLKGIIDSLETMPYGIRYIAMELKNALYVSILF